MNADDDRIDLTPVALAPVDMEPGFECRECGQWTAKALATDGEDDICAACGGSA